MTNAVVHGRRPVELRLSDDGGRIKVEISDGDWLLRVDPGRVVGVGRPGGPVGGASARRAAPVARPFGPRSD